MIKKLLLVLTFFIFCGFAPEFEREYKEAEAYLKNHFTRFNKVLEENNVSTDLALSVVFPEIVRYSKFKDFFETQALSQFYVKGAKVDFSIGHFQMKPSFIEKLEKDLEKDTLLNIEFKRIIHYPSEDIKVIKTERIQRLKSEAFQLLYLSAFIRLMQKKIPQNLPINEQIKLYATAYNYNFRASVAELNRWSEVKAFPYGLKAPSEIQYAYADVSVYFYKHTLPNLKTQ